MSEELELVARLNRMEENLGGMGTIERNAARTIMRLIRERDEARRKLEELDFLLYEGGEESIGREIEKAEAAGYRRGVEDAAKVARSRAEEISAKLLPVSAVNELRGWADVILATLEQMEPSLSPEDKPA